MSTQNVNSLWSLLNKIRGQMDTNEYKNYILPFLFYDVASFKVVDLMKDELKDEDNEIGEAARQGNGIRAYGNAWEAKNEDEEYTYREDLIDIQKEKFGFVINPYYTVEMIMAKASGPSATKYFIDYFSEARAEFEKYCSNGFKNTLDVVNLDNKGLGNTEEDVEQMLTKLFNYTADLARKDYFESKSNKDALGDDYEELMGYFAASAGKKGGEFYTPQEVSELVAKLATFEVENAKSVCDPTCGSGALLIKAAEEISKHGGIVGYLYGQELNANTSRLAKMNMCLHDVSTENFEIVSRDTLATEEEWMQEREFDVTVANPPYALEWDNGDQRYSDERFAGYNALAPKGNADLAFVQHIIYHMKENVGHAAILLPLGVLFRGNAEQAIRQAMIETKNVLDAVVVLPSNLFYGTGIPVCCLVLRKDRADRDDVFFIDASNEFVKDGKKNKLKDENINKIYEAYTKREDVEHFCRAVSRKEIESNNWNLSMSLYVQAERNVEEHDLGALFKELDALEIKSEGLKKKINSQLGLFGVTERFRVNDELADKWVEPEPVVEKSQEEDKPDFDF